jgi:hypothetical protein
MSNKLSNNTFKKKTGIQNIQEYLESGRSITALEALSNFGIFRLASAIEVLRKRGMNIETDTKQDPNGKTYARYSLVLPVEEYKLVVEAEEAPKAELKVGDRIRIKGYSPTIDGVEGVLTDTAYGEEGCPWPFMADLDNGYKSWVLKAAEFELVEAKKELKVGARVRTAIFDNGVHEGIVNSQDGDAGWIVDFPTLGCEPVYEVYMYTSELEVI